MTTEEIIARLDAMERLLETYHSKLRVLRYDLKQALDAADEDVLG